MKEGKKLPPKKAKVLRFIPGSSTHLSSAAPTLRGLVREHNEAQTKEGLTMGVWQEIWTTVLSEFSDVPDAAQMTRITLRLLIAATLGGLLGYEREQKGKAAGLRTHMLVALGAALFVLIPQQAGASVADLTRVLQGLVAGVGFLGAGAIIMGNRQEETKGMTTAAGIWLTAAIGVSAGMGREATAVLSTVLALTILYLIPKVELLSETRAAKVETGSE